MRVTAKTAAITISIAMLFFAPARVNAQDSSDAAENAIGSETVPMRGGALIPRSGGRGTSGRTNANNQPFRFPNPAGRAADRANVNARFTRTGERGEKKEELKAFGKELKGEVKEMRRTMRKELKNKRAEMHSLLKQKKEGMWGELKEKKKKEEEEVRANVKERNQHLRFRLRGRSEFGKGLRELKAELRKEGAGPAEILRRVKEFKANFFGEGREEREGEEREEWQEGEENLIPEESPSGMAVDGENLRVRNRGTGRSTMIERRVSPRLRRR